MQSQVDLAAVFDEHLRCEFEMHDASATMATMTDDPHLYHVPTMTGGSSKLPVTGAEQSEGFVNGTYATNALIVRTETVLS